jgi:hypothetical protein
MRFFTGLFAGLLAVDWADIRFFSGTPIQLAESLIVIFGRGRA